MGNNIFSLRLNTAALAAAHSFLSSHEQYDIRTQRVWVEHGTVIGENSEARGLHLTMAGWGTMTTAARLNAVMMALGLGIRWFCKNWEWHYGDRVMESTNEVVEVEV